ncbi:MAG TPA: tetratricopeptide repeat protein [Anaerolineales bacterium]|nr:tetratricopeptide repeat protein [Anaerolineales bacterium]
MSRKFFQVVFVILLLLMAVITPLVITGYSELRMAGTAGSYLEVAEHYKTAAQRLPWRADLYELSGHAYYHAAEYALAEEVYQKAFERNALSPEGWVAWGDVRYLNGDPVGAAEIWEQGLERDNFSTNLYSRLAQIHQEQAEYSRAVQYLRSYLSDHVDDASAHYRLGILLTLSEPDAALSELITASQLDPQFDPAVQTLRTALNLASINTAPSARFILIGRGLGLVEEWFPARAAFESAVEADEENAEAWAWLGEANQQTGLEGSAELDQAFQLDPDSSTVRGLRGLYFQRTGNHRAALLEFQTAATLEPDNPARYVSVGDAYVHVGDLIRALEAFQYATVLSPDDATYWRALAIFCGQNTVNLKDIGIPAAQRAVVISDEAVNLDVLGWMLLLDRRYEEAGRILTAALEKDSQDASIYLHLGMLYLQTEDRTRAFDHLIRARDLGSIEAAALLSQYFP